MAKVALSLQIKMPSKSRFQLEFLSSALPRQVGVQYQALCGFARSMQLSNLMAQSIVTAKKRTEKK
jgi:hypothetical protein